MQKSWTFSPDIEAVRKKRWIALGLFIASILLSPVNYFAGWNLIAIDITVMALMSSFVAMVYYFAMPLPKSEKAYIISVDDKGISVDGICLLWSEYGGFREKAQEGNHFFRNFWCEVLDRSGEVKLYVPIWIWSECKFWAYRSVRAELESLVPAGYFGQRLQIVREGQSRFVPALAIWAALIFRQVYFPETAYQSGPDSLRGDIIFSAVNFAFILIPGLLGAIWISRKRDILTVGGWDNHYRNDYGI